MSQISYTLHEKTKHLDWIELDSYHLDKNIYIKI